jgi:cellobiose-specific phosphotransferase system component IIC
MKHTDSMPLTPGDRDRALGLLRRISVSAGIGSLVAVGGLGYAAAASYSGKQMTASTTVAAVASATSTPSTTAASAATAAPTVAATPAPVAATAPPVAVSGGS